MPMMAHILANHHGLEGHVLIRDQSEDRRHRHQSKETISRDSHFLADADLMAIYTRFRTLVDDQMQMIENYLHDRKTGNWNSHSDPRIPDSSKVPPDHSFAKYGYSNPKQGLPWGIRSSGTGWNMDSTLGTSWKAKHKRSHSHMDRKGIRY